MLLRTRGIFQQIQVSPLDQLKGLDSDDVDRWSKRAVSRRWWLYDPGTISRLGSCLARGLIFYRDVLETHISSWLGESDAISITIVLYAFESSLVDQYLQIALLVAETLSV